MVSATEALELPRLLSMVSGCLASELGRARFAEFEKNPQIPSPEQAAATLADTAEAMDLLREGGAPPRFAGLRDVSGAVRRLGVEGALLEAHEIHDLLELLDRAGALRRMLREQTARRPRLGAYGERLAPFGDLLRKLAGKILPTGELADHASPHLERVRRQIESQRLAVLRSLERFAREHYEAGELQQDYVTIRNERLVVPVKSSLQSRVRGVIHSASSSGQTVFVEPLDTIDLNNQLIRLIEEEQREIQRILAWMTALLAERAGDLRETATVMAELEWIFAKARFGTQFDCAIPRFSPPGAARLWLKDARHPLLEEVLQRRRGEIVPMSLELSGQQRVLLLSGPNAGGKTVVLKTVGLLALMAKAGLPVPATEAELPWFDAVVADIGDAQSIAESLSTFSAHLQKLKAMMESAGEATLVLLDELGASTDPAEGGALGVAVLERFEQRGAFTLASTHLPALKIYGANRESVLSASLGIDEATLTPTYRLILGLPGRSAGLAMAERMGLPPAVLARAREALSEEHLEAVRFLQQAHEQMEGLEASRRRLRRTEHETREQARRSERELEKQYERKIRELEQRVELLLREQETAAREALERLSEKAEKAAKQRRLEADVHRTVSRAKRVTREAFQTLARGPQREQDKPAVQEGAAVKLGRLGGQGRVLRALGGGRWEVQVGQLKMHVEDSDITEVLPTGDGPPTALPGGVRFQPAERGAGPLTEINVIGKRADEAVAAVDKFLDEAVLAGVARLRIIHGHGMNVLRRALWQMFATHVHVERYYQAESREGGAGATIVELKP